MLEPTMTKALTANHSKYALLHFRPTNSNRILHSVFLSLPPNHQFTKKLPCVPQKKPNLDVNI